MLRKGLFGEETLELKPEGDRGWSWGRAGHAGVPANPKAWGEQVWGEQVWPYRKRPAWHGGARDARPASLDRGWALF